MNKFSVRWKLVFVAAAVLLVVSAMPVWSAPALAQPARAAASYPAASPAALNMLARQAAAPGHLDQKRRLSPGAIIGLICAIAASSVALGVAFGLRRRIDRIAGPDPEKADDD